ncbi:MAG: AAA family ATPase [Desulfuromusa sp.]|nr:AAA family ATPase [Desulfuromusa sp.]
MNAMQAYAPIRLKELAVECDISQAEIALAMDVGKSSVNHILNRGYLPVRRKGFKGELETYLLSRPGVKEWMLQRGLSVNGLWRPAEQDLRKAKPAGMGERQRKGRFKGPAMIVGDPTKLTLNVEVEMIAPEAMKHFKLFRNPFINDIQKDADIYMSEEHRYIEAAMIDAAKHGGFLAVIGEVGSGKSVMRRKVVGKLQKDGDTLVIYPQIIDKTRLNAGSICDAIIMDISSENPKMRLEAKTRQVHRLLLDRAKSGYRACLMIEEAHDLAIPTMKYLKRFYELEDGYKKLLGIILIGQTELRETFNEAQNVDMREVIRRVQIAEIRGLNGHLEKYLALKFARHNRKIDEIFTSDAFETLGRRLTSVDRDNKKISHAYPLLVNNYTARAMNLAYEMGEEKVTAEVIEAI